jgi:hypothetical protein
MMTMLQYNVQVGANGSILIPTTPLAIGEEVEVVLRVPKEEYSERQCDPARILLNGKTAVDDFLDFCKELNLSPLTDEEVDQAKFDYLMEKYG